MIVQFSKRCKFELILLFGRMARASAIETVDSDSSLSRVKPKPIKIGISFSLQLLCLTFSFKRDSTKSPSCAIGSWAGGSFT